MTMRAPTAPSGAVKSLSLNKPKVGGGEDDFFSSFGVDKAKATKPMGSKKKLNVPSKTKGVSSSIKVGGAKPKVAVKKLSASDDPFAGLDNAGGGWDDF